MLISDGLEDNHLIELNNLRDGEAVIDIRKGLTSAVILPTVPRHESVALEDKSSANNVVGDIIVEKF